MQKPFPQSYWVREGLLCAGHYPGDLIPRQRDRKLASLLDHGVRRVVNLIPAHEKGTGGQPFDPYEPVLQAMATARDLEVECSRIGFPDGHTPQRAVMTSILDVLDASIASEQPVYIHCWGGHGRTGAVIGCYLIRHGLSAQEAIDQIMAWRTPLPRNHWPFENDQEQFVRSWRPSE